MACSASLPSHCWFCGALLMGGATQHRPDCQIRAVLLSLEQGQRRGECVCRTQGCGHVASAHIGGSCFICGREGCWR